MGHSQEDATAGDSVTTVIKDIFLITSGLMNPYGVFSLHQKVQQTMSTIRSVRQHFPDADMVLIEGSMVPLPASLIYDLCGKDITYYQTAGDAALIMHDVAHDRNQFFVKTIGELLAYQRFMHHLSHSTTNYRRCFKISGRFSLVDNYRHHDYDDESVMILKSRSWYADETSTEKLIVYVQRLWSWHHALTPAMRQVFENMLTSTITKLNMEGNLILIERTLPMMLEKFKIKLTELDWVGVQGQFGQDGNPVLE